MKSFKRTTAQYPIRAAARLTRLSIDTLRAWEKRYSVVQPRRQDGMRMYSQADIERLSLLRQALEQGHSIGHASGLSNSELSALASLSTPARLSALSEKPLQTLLTAIENFQYS